MFGKPVEMQGRKVKGSNPYEVWYDSRLPFKFSLDVYVTLTVVNVAAIVFDICCSFWNCGVFFISGQPSRKEELRDRTSNAPRQTCGNAGAQSQRA